MLESRDGRPRSGGTRSWRTERHPCRFLMLEILFIALAIQQNEAIPLGSVTRSTSIESAVFPFNQTEHVPPVMGEGEQTAKRQTRATVRAVSEDRIFFPEEDEEPVTKSAVMFAPEPAPECKESTFCERTKFYPADYINKALKQSEGAEFLVRGVDMINPETQDIGLRMDLSDDETVPLCRSIEQVVYPRTAQNKDQEWLFIVNQAHFKQGVRIETCVSPGGECSVINRVAEGYMTTCKQNYIYRQLAAISKNGTTINETFKLPSSCCCQLLLNAFPYRRMGVDSRGYGQTPVSKFTRRGNERGDQRT